MTWLIVLTWINTWPFAVQAHGPSRFGLEAGREWIYSGSARWTGTNDSAYSGRIRWTMRCLTVQSTATMRAALVHGWLDDVAWFTPGSRPGYSVLVETEGRLFVIHAADSASAADSMNAALGRSPTAPSMNHLVIESDLSVGRVYGAAPDRGPRTDNLYAWEVDSRIPLPARPSWRRLALARTAWRLVHRTLPDQISLDFAPGVGIIRYMYSHHGTLAESDVRLIEIRDPAR